jgi:hypothetical protein
MAVELSQVISLPDVLLGDHFDFTIPNIPGGGDGQTLMIRNMTAQLPEQGNNPIPVELHRFKTHFAGKKDWGSSFQATFVESADLKVIDAIKNWQNQMTDPDTGLPKPRKNYVTTAVVKIYDSENKPAEQRTFYNLFVSKMDSVPLDGSANSPVRITVTLNYDYWVSGGF